MRSFLSFALLAFTATFVETGGQDATSVREGCINFNLSRIAVQQVRGSWKIVEGSHWIMDFGSKRREAVQSLNIIKQYGFDSMCFVGRPDPSITYFAVKQSKTTTVVVVRHAEKQSCPPPGDQACPLTASGEKRAETLAHMLSRSPVSAVFSTNLVRTKETANNTATLKGLNIQLYSTSAEVVSRIKSQHRGGFVLVVGHAPTVPQIVQGLGVASAPPVGNEYDNLFIVSIDSSGSAKLNHLRYVIDQDLS